MQLGVYTLTSLVFRPAVYSRWRTALSPTRRGLLTIAIETSCDDTAVAVVEKLGNKGILHFNKKITSDNTQYGGIHPLQAQESHERNLAVLLVEAWKLLDNQMKRKPDFISVTRGPGMYHNLREGLATAKGMSVASGIPIIGVHHMQAHALTPRLASAIQQDSKTSNLTPDFPFLNLLVSGGHSMLVRSSSLTNHTILASTGDTAVGNCIDHIAKVVLQPEVLQKDPLVPMGAKLENFAFPDGEYHYHPPVFEPKRKASYFSTHLELYTWKFPVPFAVGSNVKSKSMEYSFSSIRGNAEQLVWNGWDVQGQKMRRVPRDESLPRTVEEDRCIARDSMRVSFEHLASRVVLALQSERDAGLEHSNTLVVSGGVASNGFLRHLLSHYLEAAGFGTVQTAFPPVSLCTDNAAMIGWTGCEMWESGYSSPLSVLPTSKWSLENLVGDDTVYTTSVQHLLPD
jgi:N6-L-threonylcarbamoyladenine synthase